MPGLVSAARVPGSRREFSLAFEGCAGRAAFHVGVVDWLLRHGLHPRAVTGASSGAIVAAALAVGKAGCLRQMWLEGLKTRLFQPGRLLRGRWPFVMSEILGQASRRTLGTWRLEQVPLPLGIAVTVFRRGRFRRRLLTSRDAMSLVDAVMASCYIPGPYARMIPVAGCFALDGAWHVRAPVDDLESLDPAPRIAVVTNPEGRLEGGFPRTVRVRPRLEAQVLAPLEPLPLRGFDLDPGRHRACIEAGWRAAAAFFAENRAPEDGV